MFQGVDGACSRAAGSSAGPGGALARQPDARPVGTGRWLRAAGPAALLLAAVATPQLLGSPVALLLAAALAVTAFAALSLSRALGAAEARALALQDEAAQATRLLEQRSQAEARLRALLDAAPEPVLLVRFPSLELLAANPACERLLGWERAESLGRRATDLGLEPHPERLAAALEALERDGRVQRVAVQGRRSDGTRLSLQLSAALAELPGERSAVVVLHDATGERDLSEAVRQAQRVDLMRDLAAGVVHNFKNALAAVLPNLELALEDAPPEVAEFLKDAQSASLQAAALARQLMLISRREQQGALESVDAARTLRELIAMCRGTFDRRIRLDCVLPERATVLAPAGALEQALLNLLVNARDAVAGAEAPAISVEATVVEGPVEGGAGLPAARRLVVEVRDNGCGMDEAARARVGEAFFTTKPRGQGTGLGLATVYWIVRSLGGRVSCESAPRRGTRFTVELPLTDGAATAAAPPVAEQLTGRKVLVIDDDPLVRRALARQLAQLGATGVPAAGGGLEGLEQARLSAPDAVLLDLDLPDLSGARVLERLRLDRPLLPVLVLTGRGEHEALEGASAVLRKPIGTAELGTRISAAIERAARSAGIEARGRDRPRLPWD